MQLLEVVGYTATLLIVPVLPDAAVGSEGGEAHRHVHRVLEERGPEVVITKKVEIFLGYFR